MATTCTFKEIEPAWNRVNPHYIKTCSLVLFKTKLIKAFVMQSFHTQEKNYKYIIKKTNMTFQGACKALTTPVNEKNIKNIHSIKVCMYVRLQKHETR